MIEGWSFGIKDEEMQATVDAARAAGAQAVIVLSHNGMDVDLKMASKVRGIDAIMGGHTHDAVPYPTLVKNGGGQTLVCNAGSNSKFLGVLDMDVKGNKVAGFQYRLLPVFSNFIEADKEMQDLLDKLHKQTIKFQGKEFVAEERLNKGPRQERRDLVPPRQLLRHLGPADLRCADRDPGCGNLLLAGRTLGHLPGSGRGHHL